MELFYAKEWKTMIDKEFLVRLIGKKIRCAVYDSRYVLYGSIVSVGDNSVMVERYGHIEVISFGNISRIEEIK
jgi:ferredoxin-fold anticodon binding domain-containing protein